MYYRYKYYVKIGACQGNQRVIDTVGLPHNFLPALKSAGHLEAVAFVMAIADCG